MEATAVFVGIDVSKTHLDISFRPDGEHLRVTNDPSGHDELERLLAKRGVALVVMEATGGIEIPIASALGRAGIPLAVVNPRQVRDFAKAVGKLAKTDGIDAATLAHFAEAIRPQAQLVKDEQSQALQDFITRRRQLVEMIAMEKNRLVAARPKVVTDIRAHIGWLEKRLARIDDDLESFIRSTPLWREKDELFRSVPCVGKVLSITLLAHLPELGSLDRKKIAALTGVAPFNLDSGASRGRRALWGGRAAIRRVLYMAVVSRLRCHPVTKEFYRRLITAGKPPKVALTACMRKLINPQRHRQDQRSLGPSKSLALA